MLSKFTKQSLGLAITAGALGFGLFIGSAGSGRAQDAKGTPPAAPTGPQAQSPEEFADASAAQNEKDDTKRLALLDKWKKDFPTTPLVDARHGMYLTTYFNLKMARQAFDQAEEILKDHPTDVTALADALQMVMLIKPAPTKEDLDAGEKVAMTVLDNPAVFAADKKPATLSDAQWAQTKTLVQGYAEATILPAIYGARKDDKREVADLTKLINRDNTLYTASYQLGVAMRRILIAEQRPQDQPAMFWQMARAIGGTGAHALPPAIKTEATTFLTKAYTVFHGSADGLQDLIAQAKNSPFPPADFALKSTVDIAKDQAEADEKARAADPLGVMWRQDIKANLLKDGGEATWEGSVKDALLPPPDASGMPQYFKGTIISMTPATKPKEVVVAIGKPDVADAKLTFMTPLPGKMEPGEVIQFKGVAKEFQKDPFMITFEVDEKEDMNGSWTGKNAPGRGGAASKGAPTKAGGAKSTAKGAAK